MFWPGGISSPRLNLSFLVCAAVVVCGGVAYSNNDFQNEEFESVVFGADEAVEGGKEERKKGDGKGAPETKAPLIFIGSYQNVMYWRRIVAVMCSKGFECHCLTLPGSMTAKVGRVSSYISSNLASTPPVIFGHSLGAITAQGYASDSTNPCGGLILIAPVGFAGDEVRKVREIFYPNLEDGWFNYVVDFVWRNMFRSRWVEKRLMPLLFTSLTSRTNLTEERGLSVGLSEFFVKTGCMRKWDLEFREVEASLPSFLSSLPSPRSPLGAKRPGALVIEAGNDEVVAKASYFNTAKMWSADRKIVPGQGHNMGDEGWEEGVVGAILDFLEKGTGGPAGELSSGFDSGESSDSFVDLDAPNQDSDDENDIQIDFGDLAGETEISDEEAQSWGARVGGWFFAKK
ncbi:hypothetical protein TrCOL_g12959 [Triparma columacea]|uniref:AB hydrolase-1 domain-containing protein n=1 Tax=Triparma columacea TaxID=722753 RepID=A0A9W7GID0_9STRA|nr:hypothetical protein TrCOL_g12959 [Triparma columacea]